MAMIFFLYVNELVCFNIEKAFHQNDDQEAESYCNEGIVYYYMAVE